MLKLKRFLKLENSPELPLECESLEPRVLLSTVELFAAGDVGNELMQLQVDEVAVQTWRLGTGAAQGNFQRFVYETPETLSPDRIRVAFLNDSYDPANGIDASLRLDAMVLDGIRYETESPSVFSTRTWRPEDGVAPGFRESEYLHANGYFAFSSDTDNQGSPILIVASGSEGGEQMNLRIDGALVPSWFVDQGANNGAFQVYGFRAASTVTADQIQIEFIGDRFVPGVFDANLRVDRILVNGVEFQTESPSVFSSGTWTGDGVFPGFPQSEFLNSEGFFQYTTGGPNPGAVSLANNRYAVHENQGSVNIDIRRQGGANGTLVVDYATVPGTALPGQDYVSTSGTLVFVPGQTLATVSIPILNDSLYEGNETFSFTVDNMRGNGTLAAPRTATVLINDDDTVIPNFTSFNSAQSLQLNGDAALENGALRLTRAANNLRGSAYFATPMPNL